MRIDEITGPEFLKELDKKALKELSLDIRHYIIESVAKNGGHLASNLGAVEATIAIHKMFDSPKDKIIFDVGHQCYTHKILTGRAKGLMENFRQYQGISGFQKMKESAHDVMEAGHSSTALSIAEGMAVARDLNKEDHHIIAFVGDGAIASGLSFEALNNLAALKSKVIIILNDNEMSITKPVGGLGKMMAKIRNTAGYNRSRNTISKFFGNVPILGRSLRKVKDVIKSIFLESNIFEQMNIRYLGVIDGHDVNDICKALKVAKNSKNSIIIHLSTQKGHGFTYAANDTSGSWHGVEPFDIKTGLPILKNDGQLKNWSLVMSELIYQEALNNQDLVFITPAMMTGSKMEILFKNFPDRFFDVGIAEEHAVTFASGLALAGKLPYLSVYSTFMQRAYDNLNHDIARMKLPLIITVERAGLVGEDGDTHHGYYDVEICKGLPNNFIAMPLDYNDAKRILEIATLEKKLAFIRIPRGNINPQINFSFNPYTIGEWAYLHRGRGDFVIITTGPISYQVSELVKQKYPKVDVVFARFYHPIDTKLLLNIIKKTKTVLIYDIYATKNALVDEIAAFIALHKQSIDLHYMSLPNENVTHGKINKLLEVLKISLLDLDKLIKELY